jgi:hypothetical protein
MAKIAKGRMSAELDGEFVVFLIGMRVNKPWKLHKWFPVFRAMFPMLVTLRTRSASPRSELASPAGRSQGGEDLGLLHYTLWIGPKGPLLVQYWRSFEHLTRFATDSSLPHHAAWRAYNRRVGADGDVGVWHETYQVGPGRYEAVYVNMPAFGLAAAGAHVPVARRGDTAAQRLHASPPVPSDS